MSTRKRTNELEMEASERMRNLWFFYIMFPAALVAWSTSRKFSVTIGGFLSMPVLAFFQGFFGMLSYRCFFGDSPKPFSPIHGVVVVHPHDDDDDDDQSEEDASMLQSPLPVSKLAEYCNHQNEQLIEQAKEMPPLRLLVMGDSLAVGVGQSKTCTPVLPETIAKTISKRLGGRAVYWTCHGSPGASTGWIVKQLEQGIENKTKSVLPGCVEVQSSFSDSESSTSEEESSTDEATFQRSASVEPSGSIAARDNWKERLGSQSRIFEGGIDGPYDITVCVTGSNDLKSTFFPFLLKGEAAENWKRSQERGGYALELKRLLSKLRRVMRPKEPTNTTSPLVVFPGMPARALPAFQHFPLQHLSVPMVDIMDSHKADLSHCNEGEVLFVPPPPLTLLDEYAEHKGPVWKQRCDEKVALSLHDRNAEEARHVESKMKEYYGRRDPEALGACHRQSSIAQLVGGSPPSHWKTFSIDKTHPNEHGYDFWGRHIGNAILDEWQRLHG